FHFGEEEIDLNKIKVSFKKETLLDRESSFKILPKSLNFFSDFILLGFLSLLILVTLSKTYAPKNFKDITAFDRMYSLNIKEENIFRNGIFSYHNGYMIILFSLLASFSYCIIFSGGTRETFSFYLSNWLFTAIVVAIVVVFKMIIMGLFSRVYNMGKLFEIHYYEYLRFSILASFAVAVFSLIVGLSDMPENIYHLLASAWIIMIILRVSIVFFKLNSVVTYQYFHLFSYICATEILPFFWLVQSGYHFFG
ncbi:MAG: DUF4271 domain-containing protein, partial [Cyclobacteriaceae bacterium]|nr:DUF4271 domain-containing protein [Cyclobacteriaceae bacterium]